MEHIDNEYYRKNPENFQILKQLIADYPTTYTNQLRSKKYKEISDWIIDSLPLLSSSFYTTNTRVFWILNDIHQFPICRVCNTNKNYIHKNISVTSGYKNTCCRECAARNPDRQKKIKSTCIKRYGVENVFQNTKIIEKCEKTRIKNIGVAYPMQSKAIVEKAKSTKLKKYNDETFNNREKAKNTCIKRYGVENPQQVEEIQQKTIQTNLKKYGCQYALSNKDVIQKKKDTCIKRYGVSTYIISEENKKNIRRKIYEQLCNEDDCEPAFPLSDFKECIDIYRYYQFRCKLCGNIFWSRYY